MLVTVDDGCASAFTHVLPSLRRHGAKAIVFVTTDPGSGVFSETGAGERRLTDVEIRALVQAGVEIGSHGVSHRALSAMPDAEVRQELVDSKRELEHVTGAAVRHFAVPANWYDDRVLRIAREAGYESVFCSRPAAVQAGGGAFGIPRLNVDGGLDVAGFEASLQPTRIARRRVVMLLRGLPKRLVGPRIWTTLRESPFGQARGALALTGPNGRCDAPGARPRCRPERRLAPGAGLSDSSRLLHRQPRQRRRPAAARRAGARAARPPGRPGLGAAVPRHRVLRAGPA